MSLPSVISQTTFKLDYNVIFPCIHGCKILWPLFGVKANWGFCFTMATSRACLNPSNDSCFLAYLKSGFEHAQNLFHIQINLFHEQTQFIFTQI